MFSLFSVNSLEKFKKYILGKLAGVISPCVVGDG